MTKNFLVSFKWLLPGLGIKRWLLLAACGLVIFSGGLMLLTSSRSALIVELFFVELLESWTGLAIPSTLVDLLFALVGLLVIIWSSSRIFRSVYRATSPNSERDIMDLLYERRQLDHGLKIVAIGGGTGLSTLLRGLKAHTSNIWAIVSVSDDGGSSGRLSKELGMLPPGDIRNCMTSLADDENMLSELFSYRFHDGKGLEGHSFGNLFLAALTDMYGSFEIALQKASQILAIRGRVLPVTLTPTTLCANLADGRTIRGESEIPKAGGKVVKAFLDPADCQPPAEVLKVIQQADVIVLGPGSLYTSVIPNLLINGVAEAVHKAPAPKIYVCNVMTQPGETDGYSAADHLQAIDDHVGYSLVDYVIVNVTPPSKLRNKYRSMGAHPIKPALAQLRKMGVTPVPSNLVNEDSLVRHNPVFLAESIIELMARYRSSSIEMPIPAKTRPSMSEQPPTDINK